MPTYVPTFLVGLDLGERVDYTALSVLQRHVMPGSRLDLLHRRDEGQQEPSGAYAYRDAALGITRSQPPESAHQYRYDLIQLDRWRATGYSIVPGKLREVLQQLQRFAFDQLHAAGAHANGPNVTILVDHTGVGIAVVEEIRNAGIPCVAITITGGDQVTRDGDDYRVPKRELVSRAQVILETDRLKIARSLSLAPALVAEFDNFKARKALLTGHDSYGAGQDWREGNHDDLVLSVAMAVWFSEHLAADDVAGLESHLDMERHYASQGLRIGTR